jgi:hypothetical protein
VLQEEQLWGPEQVPPRVPPLAVPEQAPEEAPGPGQPSLQASAEPAQQALGRVPVQARPRTPCDLPLQVSARVRAKAKASVLGPVSVRGQAQAPEQAAGALPLEWVQLPPLRRIILNPQSSNNGSMQCPCQGHDRQRMGCESCRKLKNRDPQHPAKAFVTAGMSTRTQSSGNW